ncbi:hypothetical protein QFC24_003756 [Naganishia onofrii]|uniref:Uncharacterized protein n=1 Tax=Naganishia onofrii TaxID=1851511 RepID=A0ACC2XJH1_9TREE|nr:hypothetical protein QFC24_003756 [Naganishia onofrii]
MESNPYYSAGGFVAAGGSPYGASSQSPGGKGKGGQQTLRPLTIKQVLEASQPHADADFLVDGVELGNVKVIGVVRNVSTTATNVSYQVEDGTGTVDCRLWLDTSIDDNGKTGGVEQDVYVVVIGTVKSFNQRRHVSATTVRPITDMNEIHYHFLESVYVSLSARNPGMTSGGGAAAPNNGASNSYAPGAGQQQSANDRWAEFPPVARSIMEVVSSEGAQNDEGLHVAEIARRVGSSGDEMMQAIEDLISDGMLYTTIDEFHVKTT